jgi:hypothetical protein
MKYILAVFLFAIASFASANEVATPEPITLKPSVTLNNQSASNAGEQLGQQLSESFGIVQPVGL